MNETKEGSLEFINEPDNDDEKVKTEDGDEDEAIVSATTDGNLKLNSAHLHDYLLRGPALQSLSIWEYMSIEATGQRHMKNIDAHTF
jgi:hypothetical protein